MTIATEITRGTIRPYRKLEMKRRLTGSSAAYEADWVDLTPYVIDWPTIERGVKDDHVLGDFILPSISLKLHNQNRIFEDQGSPFSIWRGSPTRYLTKFKVSHGVYAAADGYTNTEVEGGTFYGVLFDEPTTSDDDTITIRIGDLLQVLQLYAADLMTNVTSGLTSAIVQRLMDITSGGANVLDKFFEVAESITTGSVTIASPSTSDKTVWEKIVEYSAAEGYIPEVTAAGGFTWVSRAASSSVAWEFIGGTLFDATYGDMIISIDDIEDGSNYIFNAASIEYADGSFAKSTASWAPGDGSTFDLFGERHFKYSLFDLGSEANGLAMASQIRGSNQTALRRYKIKTAYLPHLNTFDRVKVRYEGKPDDLSGTALYLGIGRLGTNTLGNVRGPVKINNKECKILNQRVDLNSFTSEFYLQEV